MGLGGIRDVLHDTSVARVTAVNGDHSGETGMIRSCMSPWLHTGAVDGGRERDRTSDLSGVNGTLSR